MQQDKDTKQRAARVSAAPLIGLAKMEAKTGKPVLWHGNEVFVRGDTKSARVKDRKMLQAEGCVVTQAVDRRVYHTVKCSRF